MALISTNILITTKELQVNVNVASKQINFFIGIGATYSALTSHSRPLTFKTVPITGVDSNLQNCFFTPLLSANLGTNYSSTSFQ